MLLDDQSHLSFAEGEDEPRIMHVALLGDEADVCGYHLCRREAEKRGDWKITFYSQLGQQPE